jgi:uncharacterized protein YegP (UPF0339 family)
MRFQLFQSPNMEWHWRLVSAGQQIIAVSSEGYPSRTFALGAIEAVKVSATAHLELLTEIIPAAK